MASKLLRRYIRALRKIHQLEKANRMLAEQLYLNHRQQHGPTVGAD